MNRVEEWFISGLYNDLYLHLSSKPSAQLPDNKPYRFKSLLNKRLQLWGKWKVALLSIVFENNATVMETDISRIYVVCDIVESSVLKTRYSPILSPIPVVTTGRQSYEPASKTFVPIATRDLSIAELNIELIDEDGKHFTMLDNSVAMTLCFTKSES